MLKINQAGLECKKPRYKNQTAFCAQNTSTNQVTSLPDIKPSYNLKAPVSYKKTGELNLPFDLKAHSYKLANGQQVIIVPKEGETVVKTFVRTGSMNEPDNVRGISHYIEHNLFNGSEGLEAGDFFKTVDKMGASTNAATGFAETNYYISSNLLNDDDLEKKIKIHASMIETPRFAIEMLEKEKGIINSEINMILGYPENIAVNATLKKLYNIKSSSGDLIGGSTKNITNLTREDVVDYYNNNYYPANMVTVVTGEVKPEETIKLISKYFSGNNKISHARKFEKLDPIQKTVRQDLISDKTQATHIMLGFNGPKNNDTKSQIAMEAVIELLTSSVSSRINKNLKQYSTGANIEFEKISAKPNDNRAILVSSETTEANSEKVLKTIFDQIFSVQTNPPSDEELTVIKKSLLKDFSYKFEVSHHINSTIGKSVLDNALSYMTDYENIVNSLTKEDLVNAAKNFLDLNKTVVTVLHPSAANKDSILNQYKNAISFGGNLKKQAINPDNVKRFLMPNNFDVITNNINTNNCVFSLQYDTEIPLDTKPAALEVLDRILSEGSMYRDDIKFIEDLRKDGLTVNVSSSSSKIRAAGSFAPEDMEKAFKALKEVLSAPRFSEETLNSVKKDIIDYYAREEKYANSKLLKEVFAGLPASYTKEDILNSLNDVTLDDIKKLYNHIISTGHAHVVVSAPFNKKPELNDILFKEISELKNVQPSRPYIKDTFKPVTETKVLTDTDDKNQAEIIEAFKFKTNDNIKDDVTIDLLNTILGGNASSRLFSDLREKQQLAYRVNSDVQYVDNSGLMRLKIATTTENKDTKEISYDNVKKSIEGFNKHINLLKTKKVTSEELENAKLNLKNDILSSTETSSSKNTSLINNINSPYGALYNNQVLEMIDKITPDDIYNAANYIFSQKPTYSILATENTLKANEKYLKSLVSVV